MGGLWLLQLPGTVYVPLGMPRGTVAASAVGSFTPSSVSPAYCMAWHGDVQSGAKYFAVPLAPVRFFSRVTVFVICLLRIPYVRTVSTINDSLGVWPCCND